VALREGLNLSLDWVEGPGAGGLEKNLHACPHIHRPNTHL